MITFVILKSFTENTTSEATGTTDSTPAAGDQATFSTPASPQFFNETSKLFLSEEWILLCIILACAAELADHNVKFH